MPSTYLTEYQFAVHIGLSHEHTDKFILNFQPPVDSDGVRADALAHGDGWEEWGEVNDALPAHVVIMATCRAHGFAVLDEIITQGQEEGWNLVPMTYPGQENVVASMTLSADWSSEVFVVKAGPVWLDWVTGQAA